MNNQKTILIGIAVLMLVALLVYHFDTETVATANGGITCTDPTPNHASGRELLEFWDTDNDHIMSYDEQAEATVAYLMTDGVNPTMEELQFTVNVVGEDYEPYSIDDKCPTTPITTDDMWVLGGVAVFILLIYFAFRKRPPMTPRR